MYETIGNLPPLKDVIARHQLSAHKSLGQNFLLDLNITDKIVRLAGDIEGLTVCEVGPGPGGLTRSILMAGAERVLAVEFDMRAVMALKELQDASEGRLNIIHGDALEADFTMLAESPRAIIANLPYNIATPLLVRWLRQIRHVSNAYRSMTLMFQKEVAERITSGPGCRAYGRLSILAGWLCDAQIVYTLPPGAFTPPPKVESCVVHFRPKMLSGLQPDFDAVQTLTGLAFSQRRKMIRGPLKAYLPILEKLGIDPTRRAEELSVEDYLNIAKNATQKGF